MNSLRATTKFDVKIVGKSSLKPKIVGGEFDSNGMMSKQISDAASSIRSSEVLIQAKHRKKYRALQKKIKRT